MQTQITPDQYIVLPPFATGPLLLTLRAANRQAGPVRATFIADLLGIPDRTARHYLIGLEQIGLVYRPGGPRQGWIASRRDVPAPAETGELITRAEAARRAGVTYHTVCRWITAGQVQMASKHEIFAASFEAYVCQRLRPKAAPSARPISDLARRLEQRELMTSTQVAQCLGVTARTVRRRIAAGQLQVEFVGRRRFVVAASLSNQAQIDKSE